MLVREVKHKRKSAIITAVYCCSLLFVIFNFGMQYIDPPEEYGLAINFGDSTVGKGNPVRRNEENFRLKSSGERSVVEEEVKETPKETIKEEYDNGGHIKEVSVVEKQKEVKKVGRERISKKEIQNKPEA